MSNLEFSDMEGRCVLVRSEEEKIFDKWWEIVEGRLPKFLEVEGGFITHKNDNNHPNENYLVMRFTKEYKMTPIEVKKYVIRKVMWDVEEFPHPFLEWSMVGEKVRFVGMKDNYKDYLDDDMVYKHLTKKSNEWKQHRMEYERIGYTNEK